MDWDIKWEATQAHKMTEMTMVQTGLVGRALELGSKWQPAGSPPGWLKHPLLFTKSDACERQMDRQHTAQAHFPSPRPGCVHDVLVASVWVWLKCRHL